MNGSIPHIWSFDVNNFHENIEDYFYLLSEDEKLRATKFRFDKHRKIYVLARTALRKLISNYLHIDEKDIQFSYSKYQKPILSFPECNLHFNVSHAGSRVLIGFMQNTILGIDIELINYKDELSRVAKRFFSPNEVEVFSSLEDFQQAEGFFNCWTRKEAFIKAVGQGLSFPLHEFDVTLKPGEDAILLATHFNPLEKNNWSLFDIPINDQYKAALALPSIVQGFNFHSITNMKELHPNYFNYSI